MNPFSFISDQLPLHAFPELSKEVSEGVLFKDKPADHGTVWEIISNNPRSDA